MLAVIHRDGGHYESEHGNIKALKDAMQVVLDNRLDSCNKAARIRELEEALTDKQELLELSRRLFDGADKCSQEPYYIVQPFLGIVKEYANIIEKYNLLGIQKQALEGKHD